MKIPKGADIGSVDLGILTKIADLLYYDGPLLSLFRDGTGENYLYHWCECDERVNRWLVFRVSDDALSEYLGGERSLYNLIDSPVGRFHYILDLDNNLQQIAAYVVSPKELPTEYVPEKESFFSGEQITLNADGKTLLKVSIDGDWDFTELNYFPRLLREAYGFVCVFLDQKVSSLKIPQFPMRDGLSTLHLFREILGMLTSDMRPTLEGIKYASPGAIVMKASAEAIPYLLRSVRVMEQTTGSYKLDYAALHDTLKTWGILGENAIYAKIDQAQTALLERLSVDLARSLKLPNPHFLLEKSSSPLLASKVILAYCRLLQRISVFVTSHKVSFPSVGGLF